MCVFPHRVSDEQQTWQSMEIRWKNLIIINIIIIFQFQCVVTSVVKGVIIVICSRRGRKQNIIPYSREFYRIIQGVKWRFTQCNFVIMY